MILLDPLSRPVIGHRGASGSFPENTLLAFQRAVETGADALEMDVRLTADGVPMVLHDPTVDRTTDGHGAIADLRFDAVAELEAGEGEAVPRLADVLEAIPTIPFIVELKTLSVVAGVLDLLEKTGSRDRVLLASFEEEAVRAARSRGFQTVASRRQTFFFWAVARLPLVPARVRADCFSVPETSGRISVDARFLRSARASSLPVHVWTVDEPHDAKRLWTSGVCGIISNWPERMVSARTQLQAD